jgi:hypothetical protein
VTLGCGLAMSRTDTTTNPLLILFCPWLRLKIF